MDDLSKRLRAAQGAATPHHDLWPGVEQRIRPARPNATLRAAAALLLFGSGLAAGLLLDSVKKDDAIGQDMSGYSTPMHTAAAVQQAGSEYVAAIARLRTLSPADERLQIQGYESALSVLTVAADEITTSLQLDQHDGFVAQARNAHAAVSRQTAAQQPGGGR